MCCTKRVISLLLAFLVLLVPLASGAVATQSDSLRLTSEMNWEDASNFGAYDYSISTPKTGYSMGFYTIDNGDGTVSGLVVPPAYQKYDKATGSFKYVRSDKFYVERYNDKGKAVSYKELDMELPLFGAFLAGKNYNYMAFGQSNPNRIESLEVWRIVRYDKEWNRLDSVSVTGGQSLTSEPFRSTVARMAESDDGKSLTLLASRTRSIDGHQSNLAFVMDTEPLQMKKVLAEEYPANHVSHSFGQFVQYDGSKTVTVDHGDAFPRSFVLQELNGKRNGVHLLTIAGEDGDNVTNAIGSGFEVSGQGYLFLGCSDSQTGKANEPWNVFLTYVNKSMGPAKLTWLTSGSENINCARLVKIDNNSFVAMWSESDGTHWQQLNGTGQKVGTEQILSDTPMPPTQPIVQGRDIRWIQVKNGEPTLFTMTVEESPSSWAAEFVDKAKDAGILPNNLQSKYTQPITRAEFCALGTALYESVRGEITERKSFSDTSDPNVEKMAALSVVNGTGGDKFSPNAQLTREQAATMLARLADAMDRPLAEGGADFSDKDKISSWAVDAVGKVQATGIMNGVGKNAFSPKTNYTREQSVITMVRMLDHVMADDVLIQSEDDIPLGDDSETSDVSGLWIGLIVLACGGLLVLGIKRKGKDH